MLYESNYLVQRNFLQYISTGNYTTPYTTQTHLPFENAISNLFYHNFTLAVTALFEGSIYLLLQLMPFHF